MNVLVTGSAGLLGRYLVVDLLEQGHTVVGLDNHSKHDHYDAWAVSSSRYREVVGDAKDVALLKTLLADCDHFVAGAALVGGIAYFHEFPYDLLAENERITAASFDAAIRAHRDAKLRKITLISSSMVFESVSEFPTREGQELKAPPPGSSYGFQKLCSEYFARAAHAQYRLPYTIIRPFNCVGCGEWTPKRLLVDGGAPTAAVTHVVPDLMRKILSGQDPVRLLGDGSQIRHYTAAKDIARGIRLSLEHPAALNQDFNISTAAGTTVVELARRIWELVHQGRKPFRYLAERPFQFDVQRRIPSVEKSKTLLGFEATTSLDAILEELLPWVQQQMRVEESA